MATYRKHYNPIYKLWEIQQQVEGIAGPVWRVIACKETEAEADAELGGNRTNTITGGEER